jgi:hypothetical protein
VVAPKPAVCDVRHWRLGKIRVVFSFLSLRWIPFDLTLGYIF